MDDHDIFRRGLSKLLAERDLDVVGEAADAVSAIALVGELEPDVALVDLSLPGMSGLELVRRLSREAPASRLLVLTVSEDEGDVEQAIVAGACGYLVKDTSIEAIVAAVHVAAQGDSVLSPRAATTLVARVRSESASADRDSQLSKRELSVLGHMAEGLDNREIGVALGISDQTVKKHVSSILAKLNAYNRTQAAVHAVRRGLV